MADDEHELPGLPPSALLEGYGKEVRAAMLGAIDAGISGSKRFFTRMCVATIIGAMVGSGGVTYLVSPPSDPVSTWTVHHANGFNEVCTVTPDGSGNGATFLCREIPR